MNYAAMGKKICREWTDNQPLDFCVQLAVSEGFEAEWARKIIRGHSVKRRGYLPVDFERESLDPYEIKADTMAANLRLAEKNRVDDYASYPFGGNKLRWRSNRNAPQYGVFRKVELSLGGQTIPDERGIFDSFEPSGIVADIAIGHKGLIAYVLFQKMDPILYKKLTDQEYEVCTF